MGDEGATEGRAGEDVFHHEIRASDTADHRQQPEAAAPSYVRRTKKNPGKKRSYLSIVFIALALLIVTAVTLTVTHFYAMYAISGRSMEPTFYSGQSIILEKKSEPIREGIILFHKPSAWSRYQEENDLIIKRLYGLPGDELKLENGAISINGKTVSTFPDGYKCDVESYSHRLTENQYFAMGDNILHSLDSRRALCDSLGDKAYIDKTQIVGYGYVVAKF